MGAAAHAATVDADIVFVIDNSGSMGDEFTFLGSAIGDFLNDLQADSRIGTARAGLVSYGGSTNGARAILRQDLTSDATALSNSFASVPASGSFEDAYEAVESSINDLGISYTPGNTVSLVLITDEGQDSGAFDGNTESSIGSLLDSTGYLLNIIYNTNNSFVTSLFDDIARPSTGLFDIIDFRNDRQAFFTEFTNTKIEEIADAGGAGPSPNVVPLPAAGWMLLAGIGAIAGLKRRKQARG